MLTSLYNNEIFIKTYTVWTVQKFKVFIITYTFILFMKLQPANDAENSFGIDCQLHIAALFVEIIILQAQRLVDIF